MGKLTFCFGVEMEMLIKPKAETLSRETLFERLISMLQRYDIKAYKKEAGDSLSEYESWAITTDSSLAEDEEFFGVEIISPIFFSKSSNIWTRQVDDVWKVIEQCCDVRRDDSCGTHIHISPMPAHKFTIKPLQALYKSIVIFDQTAMTSILPPIRKDNNSCRPNTTIRGSNLTSRYSSSLDHKVGNRPIFNWIDNFSEMADLVREVSPIRYCAWNSKPSLVIGSVEFRRPPQVMNSKEAKQWISIALCFAWHSIINERHLLDRFPIEKATSDKLREVLRVAAKELWLKVGEMEDL